MRILLLTIGQSPRPDLVAPLESALPPGAEIVQRGLLDGLSKAEVATRFSPEHGGTPLVTLLSDGSEVLISGEVARDALQALLTREQGALDVVVMLCTGIFDDLDSGSIRLVQPDQIIPQQVALRAGNARVGVIVPTAAQLASDQGKWAGLSTPPPLAAASPYAEDWQAGIVAAASALAAASVEWIVLDCMGYGDAHRDAVAAATGLQVVVSRQVLADSLAALVG